MWIFKKVKASALQYVLVVSVLIAIIILAFISLVYLQQKISIKNSFYKEAIQNVDLGFDFLAKNDIPYHQLQSHNFSGNPQENTTLLKKHWGIFDVGMVKSTVKNEVFEKIALLGNNNMQRDALYVQETNKPLVVVGSTRITGNASLPKQGVKTGNIAGVSYNSNRLIYGRQKLSSSSLPTIKNIDYLKKITALNNQNDSIIFFNLEENLKKIQSFKKPTAVYQSDKSVILRNISLQGNIIVQSKTAIKVNSLAKLQDVILIAPKIEVNNNVTGNFQAFASKEIKIGINCILNYPASLVLISPQKTIQEENQIFIDEKSVVKGVVVFTKNLDDNIYNFKPQIIISKNAVVTGEVYCNQNIELLGSILGSVYTKNFITKQFGSVYVNHIYNGVINSQKLPKQYCGLPISKTNVKVAKWIY